MVGVPPDRTVAAVRRPPRAGTVRPYRNDHSG
jgi:hypothetical protein